MARKLDLMSLKGRWSAMTHEGAGAYDLSGSHPLIHLTFTLGSALLVEGFYQTQEAEVRRLAEALLAAARVEPRFPWQYGAWMRDPKGGKGNRIQGSAVPAILDGLLGETPWTEDYVARSLGHRADDVIAFVEHYKHLALGAPSAAARRGVARALAGFDEYQLLKYASVKGDVRLCDVIYLVKAELEALGEAGRLALEVGAYLHAPTRARDEAAEALGLPLAQARRRLFRQPAGFAQDPSFVDAVQAARTTWEQVLGCFGASAKRVGSGEVGPEGRVANRAVWEAMLAVPGLLPDMALLRNLRNLRAAGFTMEELEAAVGRRRFAGVWPHQIYAGYKAERSLEPLFSQILANAATALLPPGRHLGIGDISGSMGVRVGGLKGSTTAMDVSLCLVGLMSETSGLGASFDSGIHIAQRRAGEGPLSFTQRPEIQRGWGSTQVFGAVMELIRWLRAHPTVQPPECLWFFSDMQFHPAAPASVPAELAAQAKELGVARNAPPLEMALALYRSAIGPVDVVLWNLAAYAPTPVPASMKGVLLVSGFDANTFKSVAAWRRGEPLSTASVEVNQEVILDVIRSY